MMSWGFFNEKRAWRCKILKETSLERSREFPSNKQSSSSPNRKKRSWPHDLFIDRRRCFFCTTIWFLGDFDAPTTTIDDRTNPQVKNIGESWRLNALSRKTRRIKWFDKYIFIFNSSIYLTLIQYIYILN